MAFAQLPGCCCATSSEASLTCPDIYPHWENEACPIGWLAFVIRYRYSAPCDTGDLELLFVYDGSGWVRPANPLYELEVEAVPHGDGTYDYRITHFSDGTVTYDLNSDGNLSFTSGVCCIGYWATEIVPTRRIWFADDLASKRILITADGVTTVSATSNCLDTPYAVDTNCEEINNRSWELEVLSATYLIDGYYLFATFDDLEDAPVTGATFGGECHNAYDDVSCSSTSEINNFYWASQHYVVCSSFGGVPFCLATYANLTAGVSFIQVSDTDCSVCCYTLSGDCVLTSFSMSASIACSGSTKTTLDELAATEWVFNGGEVCICDSSAATLTAEEL